MNTPDIPDIPERYPVGEAILEAALNNIMSCPSNKVLVQDALNRIIVKAEDDSGYKMRADSEISVHLVVTLQREGDDGRFPRLYYSSANRNISLLKEEHDE